MIQKGISIEEVEDRVMEDITSDDIPTQIIRNYDFDDLEKLVLFSYADCLYLDEVIQLLFLSVHPGLLPDDFLFHFNLGL